MDTAFKPDLNIENLDPEIKAFIYQTLMEFEPYTTPETVVAVVAKDPLHLMLQFEADGIEMSKKQLKKLWRISIALNEDGGRVEEEGLHADIYEAIKMAKDKLLKTLIEMQDSAISNQERIGQINMVREAGSVH